MTNQNGIFNKQSFSLAQNFETFANCDSSLYDYCYTVVKNANEELNLELSLEIDQRIDLNFTITIDDVLIDNPLMIGSSLIPVETETYDIEAISDLPDGVLFTAKCQNCYLQFASETVRVYC